MKSQSLKIPSIIIAIGLVLCLVVSLFAGIMKEPVITEHDFNYAATYRLDGETKTLEGVYRVQEYRNITPLPRKMAFDCKLCLSFRRTI